MNNQIKCLAEACVMQTKAVMSLEAKIGKLEKQNAELKKPIDLKGRIIFTKDSLQTHNLEQRANGAINIANKAIRKVTIPDMSPTKTEYFKAGIRILAAHINVEAKAIKDGS